MAKKNPLLILLAASGVFFVLFLIFVAVVISNMNSHTAISGGSSKKLFGKNELIGIVEIKGVIMDSKKFIDDISDFVDDSRVKGIIVHINSPGGAVAPSQEIYDAIKAADEVKPVYASMSSLAASGGYYAALGTRKIYANPGTITGSIGVIMGFANMSRLYEWAKVTPYTIKTGKFKDIGSPTRDMTPEDRELLQGMVDNVVGQFRKAVADSRKLPMSRVIELSDGRIFSGEQAKEVKLIDDVAGLQNVIKIMAKDVGISGKPRVVYPVHEKRFLDFLVQGEGNEDEKSNIGSTLAEVLDGLKGLGQVVKGLNGASASYGKSSLVGPQFLAPFSGALGQ